MPVSYRAAYTFEPIKNLVFYSMFATAYNPAAADRRQAIAVGRQGRVDAFRLRHRAAKRAPKLSFLLGSAVTS
jgi:hypothetical protein